MELNERITFFTGTRTATNTGGATIVWNSGVQIWAAVDIVNYGKLFVDGKEYNGTYYIVSVRTQDFNYSPPIEKYKIDWNDFNVTRHFKIISAKNERKQTFTVFNCIEANG